MARNAKATIVEAEPLVEPGNMSPAAIYLPGIWVDKVVQRTTKKRTEKVTSRKDDSESQDLNKLGT